MTLTAEGPHAERIRYVVATLLIWGGPPDATIAETRKLAERITTHVILNLYDENAPRLTKDGEIAR